MRDIKFRAWNKEYKQMSNVFQIQYDEGKIDSVLLENTDDTWYVDDIELMQYTGLIDKNDNEICEGDIVKWGHILDSYENPQRIAIVEFNPDIQFRTINLGRYNRIFRYGGFSYKDTDKALEVIGNIYKNPSLLEV